MIAHATVAEISSDRIQRAFEHAPIGVAVLDLSGRAVYVNATLQRILGYSADELGRMMWMECIHPEDLNGEHALVADMVSGRHDDYQLEKRYLRKDGGIVWGKMSLSLVRDAEGRPHSVLSVFQDISDWKRDQDHLQRQLDRLSALRVIDQAISGSLDLSLILNVLLEQTVTQLRVSAAAILLAEGSILTYGARRGFQTEALKYTRLRFGEGYAGRAAMSRQRVLVADLRLQPGELARSKELPREGFAGYAAVPLLAKGHVKGVLEVFCREPLVVQPDWLDFLDALASQAAIAIDNAGMLASLQVKNTDLTMAYDSTLEAWSRLMDLKDAETEGHSQRVTDVALQLAREMRVAGVDLPDVRRGALLH
ncbi:MAG: PAS domain S-box protein, partial [bacterium]